MGFWQNLYDTYPEYVYEDAQLKNILEKEKTFDKIVREAVDAELAKYGILGGSYPLNQSEKTP